jgi:hypothetical protein
VLPFVMLPAVIVSLFSILPTRRFPAGVLSTIRVVLCYVCASSASNDSA